MRKAIRYELAVMLHKKEFVFAFCIMMLFCLASFIGTGDAYCLWIWSV